MRLRLPLAALLTVSLAAATAAAVLPHNCYLLLWKLLFIVPHIVKRGENTYNRWNKGSLQVVFLPLLLWYTLVFVRVSRIDNDSRWLCLLFLLQINSLPTPTAYMLESHDVVRCCCKSVCYFWFVFTLPVRMKCRCCSLLHYCRCVSCGAAAAVLLHDCCQCFCFILNRGVITRKYNG